MSKWKILRGSTIQDLPQWIREETAEGQILHIGCDSLQQGRFTQFCTVIVILNPGKGGRVAYMREKIPRLKSLRERLWQEVWRSVELANQLSPVVQGNLTVHIDANPEERHMSSKYIRELTSLVVGYGFRYLIKPDAFVATTCADWTVRHIA